MSNSLAELWRETFENWPPTFRRKGVLIPVAGESIPFCDFLMTKNTLVLERPTPDNVGARRVAIPFERIDSLKYTEPLKTEHFLEAGGYSKGRTEPTPPPTRRIAPTPAAPVPVGQQQQQGQQQQAQQQPVQPQAAQPQPGVQPAAQVPRTVAAPQVGPQAVSEILQQAPAPPQQPTR